MNPTDYQNAAHACPLCGLRPKRMTEHHCVPALVSIARRLLTVIELQEHPKAIRPLRDVIATLEIATPRKKGHVQ